jgi:hypothetical protein
MAAYLASRQPSAGNQYGVEIGGVARTAMLQGAVVQAHLNRGRFRERGPIGCSVGRGDRLCRLNESVQKGNARWSMPLTISRPDSATKC